MHLEQKAGLRSDKSASQVPSIHLGPTPGTLFDTNTNANTNARTNTGTDTNTNTNTNTIEYI